MTVRWHHDNEMMMITNRAGVEMTMMIWWWYDDDEMMTQWHLSRIDGFKSISPSCILVRNLIHSLRSNSSKKKIEVRLMVWLPPENQQIRQEKENQWVIPDQQCRDSTVKKDEWAMPQREPATSEPCPRESQPHVTVLKDLICPLYQADGWSQECVEEMATVQREMVQMA